MHPAATTTRLPGARYAPFALAAMPSWNFAPGAARHARLIGALWLGVVVTGMFGFVVMSRVLSSTEPASLDVLRASETLVRLGWVSTFVAGMLYLGVTTLLYGLLKPVSRSLSLTAAAFGAMGVTVSAAASLLLLVPFALLGAAAPGGFTGGQLEVLAGSFVRLGLQGSNLGMPCFGVQIILVGYLITRSGFLPRVLGLLLMVGGSCYVLSALAAIVVPALGPQLGPIVGMIAMLGEGALAVWLVARGVDADAWEERALRGAA